MTLNTEVIATTPCDGVEIFHKCRQLLGATGSHPFAEKPEQEWDCTSRAWHDTDVRHLGNRAGIGLDALLWVYYRPQLEPRRTPEEAAAHDENCEPDCDGTGWSHEPACWVEIHFDTAYGFRDEQGRGCGDLHAALLFELGQWFDERNIGWGWQNEFTGEWHYEDKYEALKELCADGGRAMAWFTESVQPLIESAANAR
jgi:hypothetical protein